MIKEGCENKLALFIHLIFNLKKNLTLNESKKKSESGGKSH